MESYVLISCQPVNLFTKSPVLYIVYIAVWTKSTSVGSVCTDSSENVFMGLLKVCFLEEDNASVCLQACCHLFMHHKQHKLSRLVHTESFIMVHGDVETNITVSVVSLLDCKQFIWTNLLKHTILEQQNPFTRQMSTIQIHWKIEFRDININGKLSEEKHWGCPSWSSLASHSPFIYILKKDLQD